MKKIITHGISLLLFIVAGIIFNSCEPLATGFEETEDATMYTAGNLKDYPLPDSAIRVMTWNIRFGIGRTPWFGDACGNNTILSKEEVMPHLEDIVNQINVVKPDILFLQECDILSKRTAYIDELQYILDHTHFNYAAYVSEWKSAYIPSDGLGRMDMGQVILSPWPITESKRINLATRGDQSGIVNYFYLHSCVITGTIKIPGFKEFSVLNIHASAFATDDTKQKHFEEFKAELDRLDEKGVYFVAGGDLNTLPPGSDSTDFCYEDMCPGESFHQPGDDPMHKPGSDYTPESTWILPLYSSYKCAVPLTAYQSNQSAYFTHTTRPEHTWDRTLDYLFTNHRWVKDSDITHQDAMELSDHAAVSAEFVLIKE
ncbi:MAG: endonuclease/exonuclease/phosphatase family protein [Bacteroidales bacterium]|nr:endonuclease/exonuclease/phosphatase family protein [Bacteroidales bacterium]